MATDDRLASPSTAVGAAPSTTATPWTPGAYVVINTGFATDIAITGIDLSMPDIGGVSREIFLEFAKGATGSEVVFLQVPITLAKVSAVGYLAAPPVNRIDLPEPVVVPASTQISVRITDNVTAANVYRGIKIFYEILATVVSKSDSDSGTASESAAVTFQLQTGVARVTLPSIPTPISADATNTTIYTRSRKANLTDGGVVNFALYQGATLIESWSVTLTDSFATDAHSLANVASITDWTTLELRISATSDSAGTPLTAQVSQAYLETPAGASVTPVSDTDSGSGADAQTLKTAISATDANSATTEASALAVHTTATDTNGTTTEVGSPVARIIATDTNGSVTEVGTVVFATTVTDASNAGSDAQALAARISATDSNGYAETASIVNRVTATDTNGTTTEAASVSVPVSATDTNGTVTEANTLVAVISATDTNGYSEIASIKLTAADQNSTTTEAASAAIAESSADAGTASEIASIKLIGVDAGSDTEAQALTAQIFATDSNGAVAESAVGGILAQDTGAGTDLSSVVAKISATESGSGADSASVGTLSQVSGTDSGSGSESASEKAVIPAPAQSGSGADVASLAVSVAPTGDAGTASESASVRVFITNAESASAVEQAILVFQTVAADAGISLDVAQVQVTAISSDGNGAVIENGFVGNTTITDTDQGIGDDLASVLRGGIFIPANADHAILSAQLESGTLVATEFGLAVISTAQNIAVLLGSEIDDGLAVGRPPESAKLTKVGL